MKLDLSKKILMNFKTISEFVQLYGCKVNDELYHKQNKPIIIEGDPEKLEICLQEIKKYFCAENLKISTKLIVYNSYDKA
jgi:hypothetical protein